MPSRDGTRWLYWQIWGRKGGSPPPGDSSLVAAERELIASIRSQALALKRQGLSVEEAGKQVSDNLHKAHPDLPDTNAAEFVRSVYADPAG